MDAGSVENAPTSGFTARESRHESCPEPGAAPHILMIAYDGSPNADRAIGYAGRFLRAGTAHVVTAWQPGSLMPDRISSLSGGLQPYVDTTVDAGIDRALEEEAARINARGVEIARTSGLNARGSLVEVESTVWGALVAAADALEVDLLVTGTRGTSGLKALLRSSVAERVLKHCHRPVFIVPAACDRTPEVIP